MEIGNFLKMDEKKTCEKLKKIIIDLLEREAKDGILIGLSGGIDSALLTTLAVKAVGSENVKVSYIYDCDNESESKIKAEKIAKWLNLKLDLYDMTDDMKNIKIYSFPIIHLVRISKVFNRSVFRLWNLLFNESPFISILNNKQHEYKNIKKTIYNTTLKHIEAGVNTRHIFRRQYLEKKAASENLLLLGAANRSEAMVGWFVKGGVDDLIFQPLLGLYKAQVRQLASHLNLPDEIQNQIPSPDMMKGITDEFMLGIKYERLDIILAYLENEKCDEDILKVGITKEELELVKNLNKFSSWKRNSPHINCTIDTNLKGESRKKELTS